MSRFGSDHSANSAATTTDALDRVWMNAFRWKRLQFGADSREMKTKQCIAKRWLQLKTKKGFKSQFQMEKSFTRQASK